MKYLNKRFMVPVGQIRDESHPKAADLDELFPKKKLELLGKKGKTFLEAGFIAIDPATGELKWFNKPSDEEEPNTKK